MRTILIYSLCVIAVVGVFGKVSVPTTYASNVKYTPLAPIDAPGSEFTQNTDCVAPTCFPRYLRTIYNVGIGLAGLFAVFSIVRGGFTLIFTDSILGHSEAKGIILRALGGLVIVYSSYIFMNQISPSLGSDLDLSFNFPSIQLREDLSKLTVVTAADVQNAWNKQLHAVVPEVLDLKEQAKEKERLANLATDPATKATLLAEAKALTERAVALETKTLPSVQVKERYMKALSALWDTGDTAKRTVIKDASGKNIPLGSASNPQRIAEAERELGLLTTDPSGKKSPQDLINQFPAGAERATLQKELDDAKVTITKQIGYLERGCTADGKKRQVPLFGSDQGASIEYVPCPNP